MKRFGESLDFGGEIFFVVVVWWLVAAGIVVLLNSLFVLIGTNLARRKNRQNGIFTEIDSPMRTYLLASVFPLVLLTLGWLFFSETLILLLLAPLISIAVGYIRTLGE